MAEGVSDEEQSARIHYFLGLTAKGRTGEAADFLPQVVDGDGLHTFDSAVIQMRNAGLTEEVYQLFSELLSRDPQANFWETYISLAVETGHGDEMLVKIQAAANDPNLRPKQLRALQRHLRDARLAVDQVEAGVALIRKELEACDSLAGDEVDKCLGTALRLAELGRLLDRAEWVEEGLRFAQQSFEAADPESYEAANSASELIKMFLTLKRGPEAEQLAKFRLAKTLRSSGSSTWGDWGVGQFYQSDDQVSALSRLVHVYAEAGRHADVVALLDEAPWWGAKDLAHIEWLVYMENNATLLLDAAEALAETGKTDQARHIVRKILGESSGDDRAHQLLVELEGQRAVSFLDQLAARDRFEERPLIWKAKLLLDDGKVDQAEQVVKQAVAMDPSDGEQGKGDRMRAYAVLADIHHARGDKQEEEFYRRIVRAIRLAEEADDFYAAGLKMRGIAMYREALLQFADAYCIQSRIAIQLAEVGKLDEAADHYQRAYELMPDSFGRVESHCFGCEAAFTGDLAQSTAERVFARIAANQPRKPQIHYLIGYLRNSQQRYTEALAAYRRAVELDPDYLNAWHQILDLRDKIFLTRELQDEATFNVLRLDPLGKHVSAPTGEVADLAELWRVFSKHRLEPIVVPESLYPLKASREQLEELERLTNKAGSPGQDPWGEHFAEMRSWREESNAPITAGGLLSQHSVVSAICTWFDELPGSK